jgi:hypothetical protein
METDEDGRGFAREDMVWETRRDDEVAQGSARRRPRDEDRGGQHREDQEEQIVARVVGGESDGEEDADED